MLAFASLKQNISGMISDHIRQLYDISCRYFSSHLGNFMIYLVDISDHI